jgi:hypothetical protein
MPMTHLVEVDEATGKIVGEWRNDTDKIRLPIAPAGHRFIDVTDRHVEPGALSLSHHLVDGQLVARPPKSPVVDNRTFLRLFTRDERLAIAAQRDSDPEIADFWLLLSVGQSIDLGHQDTAAGLELLVERRLLSEERRTSILANESPLE